MKPRLAALLVLCLLGLAAATILIPRGEPAEPAAWALIAPKLTPHRCEAPASEAYAARDVHWIHVADGGISMATPRASGRNALLGMFEPLGTVVWDENGCEVVPLESRMVQVRVTDATGEPVDAIVASCPWSPLTATVDGAAALELPIGVRCKLVAYQLQADLFLQSPAQALDDTDDVTLVINPMPTVISEQQAVTRAAIERVSQHRGSGPYARAIDAATDPATRAVLERWQGEYTARQEAAFARLRGIAAEDDGWMRLSR